MIYMLLFSSHGMFDGKEDDETHASFPHTYILVCDPTVSDRKSIHSYVILRNVRFSSETPPLRMSVIYVQKI